MRLQRATAAAVAVRCSRCWLEMPLGVPNDYLHSSACIGYWLCCRRSQISGWLQWLDECNHGPVL